MGIADELAQLREGSMLDYDMETWEVTTHESYSDPGWPANVWVLERETDVLYLEHEDDSRDVFRLSKPVRISEITVEDGGYRGEPVLAVVREGEAPGTIGYQGESYVITENDARVDTGSYEGWTRSADDYWLMGVCGGYAEHKGKSSTYVRFLTFVGSIPFGWLSIVIYIALAVIKPVEPDASNASASREERTHYWVYENGDDFVALECWGSNDWDAYAGREVEPYEFDNVLPSG